MEAVNNLESNPTPIVDKPAVKQLAEKVEKPIAPPPFIIMVAGLMMLAFGVDWAITVSGFIVAGVVLAGIGVLLLYLGGSQLQIPHRK